MTRVIEAGTEGIPMVLVHGLTSRADRWRQNIDRFAQEGYHVYALDLPGHGFADKDPHLDHSITGYRDFIIKFLDRIDARVAVLVGTSLGGHLVGSVTCHRPERVSSAIMIGSLGLVPLETDTAERLRVGVGDMRLEAVRARLLTVFQDKRFVTDDLVREDVRINTSPGARESLRALVDDIARNHDRELVVEGLRAQEGEVPILLVWGEYDRSTPVDTVRNARGRLSRARMAIIKGVAHTPYLERPEVFHQTVSAFLSGKLWLGRGAEVDIE